MRPEIKIVNVETGEETTREMNDEEFAQFELDQAKTLEKQTQAQAEATAKTALLTKLGITADEAKLLLS